MRVEVSSAPDPQWDAFAESRAEASLGHAAAWSRVTAHSYRLPAYHLIARDAQGAVAGILALARLRSWRGRVELVSLPFLDSAGILASEREAQAALLERALELTRELGAASLELREEGSSETICRSCTGDRVDLVLPLEESEEHQWKALGAKVRNQTRKAEREGLVLSDAGPADDLADFYAVYCQNMRDLGSPPHARAFFQAIQEGFGPRARFVVTRLDGRPVGGLVAIHFGARVTVPWASTLRSERARCPNNQIYWEAIRWAIARGARELDFGRSPRGGGTYRFKLGWGAQERKLRWQRLSARGQPLPGTAESDHLGLRLVSRAWQVLPVPVASFIGARVRHLFAR